MTLDEKTLQRMEELTQLFGISGQENDVRAYLAKKYEALCDEVIYDNLGSVFGVKKSSKENAKTVLLAGHMDEIGFVVRDITSTGCCSLSAIGGWWNQTLLGQRILLKNRAGKTFKGVIGSIPPHLLSDEDRVKPMEIKNMLVDIGAVSKEETLSWGILPGDGILVEGPFVELENGNRLLAKAWDNRYGCIMGLEVLEALKDVELNVNLVVGATVQEEVGLRGATTGGYLVKPDVAIVFDCSPANDATGKKEEFGQLGKGPLVRFIDANYVPHRGFLDAYVDLLEQEKIPYQYYQSMGGTDAGALHKLFEGVLTLTMCICARNIHTNSSIIDRDDFLHARQAAIAMVRSLTPEKIDALKLSNR
ncbi:MAG: M42 family metallopeptidase [Erysipelotrichaceae bacterium]